MKYINQYQIIGLLGRGGMGRVYKVLRPELGKIMALKLLDPNDMLEDLMGREEIERQFIHEARIMGRLSHPNIASVWDTGRDDQGRLFMVMEYFCQNLGTIIGETHRVEDPCRPLPPSRVFHYAMDMLDALARLHYAGIIHRDIKPFNMMITGEDRIKLIDFGLSRLRGEPHHKGPSNLKIGSPYYTSPEQEADPSRADHRSDIYSAGMVIFRMLTGRLPMHPEDRDLNGLMLDNIWDDFFSRCLHPDPDKRFASAMDMKKALEQLRQSWETSQQAICRLLPESFSPPRPGLPASPRRVPVRTGPVAASKVFPVDALARPQHHVLNVFEAQGQDGWKDGATGLTWSKSPSPFPLTWEEARTYLDGLNQGAHQTWRLPTVDELITLIQPKAHPEDLCTPTIVDTGRKWFWSADTRTFTQAWFVDLENGYVAGQDRTCLFHVLAVRA
ncbi:protein kinase domain-containing protein [Desulfoplanes formicivorans]|uniref:Serine/threonine protein kinase n=1 Tax=Desulfoplanes formicivorans TaxID=1592317 RepID=A0A194AGN9_9BACT|nr:protein kinase [Desulfoplanes formicivorans]GAU09242.1 serine/threonine protein kinase [Desulfoplanes formicivorans]